MTQAEIDAARSATDAYQAALEEHEARWPDEAPEVLPGFMFEAKGMTILADLLRDAMKRGEPLKQAEADKALGVHPNSWEW